MEDHALIRRRDFTQATLDQFINLPQQWGVRDCGKLVTFHLRQFGVNVGVAKIGSYSTALGAQRAIRRLGVKSMAEYLDQLGLQRIAPAAALIGDIIEMESEGSMDALSVALGNGVILGYVEGLDVATTGRPLRYPGGCWRVPA